MVFTFKFFFTDCPQVCTSDYTPVCGTDSKTYSNECAMEVAACKDGKTDLTVAYVGECSGISHRVPTNVYAAKTYLPKSYFNLTFHK